MSKIVICISILDAAPCLSTHYTRDGRSTEPWVSTRDHQHRAQMSTGWSSSVILADRSAAVGNLQGFGVCVRLRVTIVGLLADEDARAEDKTSSVVTETDESQQLLTTAHRCMPQHRTTVTSVCQCAIEPTRFFLLRCLLLRTPAWQNIVIETFYISHATVCLLFFITRDIETAS